MDITQAKIPTSQFLKFRIVDAAFQVCYYSKTLDLFEKNAMNHLTKSLISCCLFIMQSQSVFGQTSLTVEDVLQQAMKSSEALRASEQSLEATEAEIRGRDGVLSPVLSADLSMFKDERESPQQTIDHAGPSSTIDTSLIKPFSTGTKITANASHNLVRSDDFDPARNIASWDVRVSQSLLRNGFGSATQHRRLADAYELKSKRYTHLMERQRLLVEIEGAYWDLVLAKKEEMIHESNIKRRSALEKWTQNKIKQFAAESVDLLQVQTLLTQLRLDLNSVKGSIDGAYNKIRQLVPDVDPSQWTLDVKSLESDRDVSRLALMETSSIGTPTRLDALAADYLFRQTKEDGLKDDDGLKPLVDAYASYGANDVDANSGTAWRQAARAKQPVARVGIMFSMELHGDIKDQKRTASRLKTASQELQAKALQRESSIAWTELQRQIASLRSQAKEAKELSALQLKKVNAERRRFEQGRTNTLQMTTFEVDATTSELRLYRILAELRKTESLARTFTFIRSEQL